MTDLTDEPMEALSRFSDEGNALAEAGKHADALPKFWAAFDVLPEPQPQFEAATWLLGSIGDANFQIANFEAGRDNLANALHCPDAIGNPFLHLRLGQCQLELGDEDRAADELARAYMGAGHELFTDEDPKYFAFLKTRLDEPPNGWEDEKKPWWKIW